MPNTSSLSCPNCEYEHNSRGKPVQTGEHIKCMDCGKTWKEYSGSGNLRLEHKTREAKVNELRNLARQKASAQNEAAWPAQKVDQTTKQPAETGMTLPTAAII